MKWIISLMRYQQFRITCYRQLHYHLAYHFDHLLQRLIITHWRFDWVRRFHQLGLEFQLWVLVLYRWELMKHFVSFLLQVLIVLFLFWVHWRQLIYLLGLLLLLPKPSFLLRLQYSLVGVQLILIVNLLLLVELLLILRLLLD